VQAVYDQLNEKILVDLRDKSIEQLKKELREDPPDVQQYIYELALEAEQYEVCETVKQLKLKRQA